MQAHHAPRSTSIPLKLKHAVCVQKPFARSLRHFAILLAVSLPPKDTAQTRNSAFTIRPEQIAPGV